MEKKLIRFDWALKRILRNKANFGVLEGFLAELLGEDVNIRQILESESNKETENDKHNRVDLLVENARNELVVIGIQNSKQYDYFHRILYGTSKIISEHIDKGQNYSEIKKVISITIAYFDLGQGKDYVYHGATTFEGIHQHDVLTLSDEQMEMYHKNHVHEIYPEYWIIKVSQFGDLVKDKLDEWIYFFKNDEIKNTFSAKGLKEAAEKLDSMKLNQLEAKEYAYFLKRSRDIASEQETQLFDAQLLIKKGIAAKEKEWIHEMDKIGLSISQIAQIVKKTEEEINEIIRFHIDR